MAQLPPFPLRQNSDDSWDAICPRCFQTIATERNLERLRLLEIGHECDPDELARMQYFAEWLKSRNRYLP